MSASRDATVKLWNAESGELVASFLTGRNGEWLVLTPEGFFAASNDGGAILSVVRRFEPYSVDQFYQTLHRPDLVREKLLGDPQHKVRAAAAECDLAKIIANGPASDVSVDVQRLADPGAGDKSSVAVNVTDDTSQNRRARAQVTNALCSFTQNR